MAFNPRNEPIDPSIPPHEWTITQLNNKNKPARTKMCDNNGIEYEETDGNSALLEFLLAHRVQAIKDNKNKLLREAAKAKREAANKQRRKGHKSSKNSRNKPDSIRQRPAPLNPSSFNMNLASFVVKDANKKQKKEEKKEANEKEAGDSQIEIEKEEQEAIDASGEEAVNALLDTMDLKPEQVVVLKGEEYECVFDLLSVSEKELLDMGFKRGARKAIIRKFAAEKKKRGIFENVEGGIDGNNVVHALIKALNANNANNRGMKNDGNNNEEQQNNDDKKKVVKLWDKRGSRQCYIGPVKEEWPIKYRLLILKLIMMALGITDASLMREDVFRKTRSGFLNKMRLFFDLEEEKKETDDNDVLWPYQTMVMIRKLLEFLHERDWVVIFESDYVNGQYSARFGRNPISTVLALKTDIVERDDTWQWMKDVRNDMPWIKYADETGDVICGDYNLLDFDGDGPDWIGFDEWKESNVELRRARDPNEGSE